MMKTLSVLGTIAMFLVGGGILTHGIPAVYGAIHHVAGMISSVPEVLVTTVGDGLFGLLAGAILVLVITPVAKLWERRAA
jgi:predicted DNA repair protein MutK